MNDILTQVYYKRSPDGAHMFYGRDRISTGLLVGNKDFKEAMKAVKAQLKECAKENDTPGTFVCNQSDDDLEKFADQIGEMMTVWKLDRFSR